MLKKEAGNVTWHVHWWSPFLYLCLRNKYVKCLRPFNEQANNGIDEDMAKLLTRNWNEQRSCPYFIIIEYTVFLWFYVAGFESILEGIYGSILTRDLNLFDGGSLFNLTVFFLFKS